MGSSILGTSESLTVAYANLAPSGDHQWATCDWKISSGRVKMHLRQTARGEGRGGWGWGVGTSRLRLALGRICILFRTAKSNFPRGPVGGPLDWSPRQMFKRLLLSISTSTFLRLQQGAAVSRGSWTGESNWEEFLVSEAFFSQLQCFNLSNTRTVYTYIGAYMSRTISDIAFVLRASAVPLLDDIDDK